MKRKRIARMGVAALVSILLVGGIAPIGALADPEAPGRVEEMLGSLSDVLSRLESELAALQAPKAERLEEGVEQIIELVEGILREIDQPKAEEDGPGARARILRLDLMLHRLVYALEEIVEASDGPRRPADGGALDGLRRWIDGYVDGMTAGVEPRVAERFEQAVHEMVRDLGMRVAEMAKKATPERAERPALAMLVERLEDVLFKLDAFILNGFSKPGNAPKRP